MGTSNDQLREWHRNASPDGRAAMERAHPWLAADAAPKPARLPAAKLPAKSPIAVLVALVVRLDLRLQTECNANEQWWRKSSRAKRQRAAVRAAIAPFLAQLRSALPVSVTMVRIGARDLDSHDNLQSCTKHVADEIAAVLGVDDADDAIEWKPVTQRRGRFGVEITIASRNVEHQR